MHEQRFYLSLICVCESLCLLCLYLSAGVSLCLSAVPGLSVCVCLHVCLCADLRVCLARQLQSFQNNISGGLEKKANWMEISLTHKYLTCVWGERERQRERVMKKGGKESEKG